MALLRMVDFQMVKKIWRTNRVDLLSFFVTFFACLYQLQIGILCGVVMAMIVSLHRRFVPEVEIQGDGNGRCCFKLNGGLTYVGVEYFTSKVREKMFVNNGPDVLILDCSTMFECDFTVTERLVQLYYDCRDGEIRLIFYYVRKDVQEMLEKAGLPAELFKDSVPGELSGLLNK